MSVGLNGLDRVYLAELETVDRNEPALCKAADGRVDMVLACLALVIRSVNPPSQHTIPIGFAQHITS